MEDFKVNYYANHVNFMICLVLNRKKTTIMGPCAENFDKITDEALFRDIASRAYYASYLSARDKLIDGKMLEERASTDHSYVTGKLSTQFQSLLKELKIMRKSADYNTKEKFLFPQKTRMGTPYPLMRLQITMNKFLEADHNKLTP